jgi:hypothetical protein
MGIRISEGGRLFGILAGLGGAAMIGSAGLPWALVDVRGGIPIHGYSVPRGIASADGRGMLVLGLFVMAATFGPISLEPVPRSHPPVSSHGSLVGRGRGVPTHHLAGAPARQSHQVSLVPAIAQPTMRERVAEHVRGHLSGDASIRAAALEELAYPAVCKPASRPQPEPRFDDLRVGRPRTDVAVQLPN